ncbi:MAG TPA: YicC/YloC family endoribonuclease [Gemmataceae bacterium]|nr:YicC/YloC family endoribonuclease [Gemmataceae bacterium]
MLLSMTGYGEGRYQSDTLTVSIELRALNNRYLKVSVRAGEPYNLLESEFEKVIRRSIRRGTVQVNMRLERQYAPQDYRINVVALRSYLRQLQTVDEELGLRSSAAGLISPVLALPGVVPEPGGTGFDVGAEWPLIENVLEKAVEKLQAMRQEEGRAMAQEFLRLRDEIANHLTRIRDRAPQVADLYRDRLLDRVRKLVSELDIQIDRSDLIKEVSIYAERSDIAEEVVRLASHLDQFQEIMNEAESPGRKLEFLTQEMFREANTIGSKASDVEISRHVVEIKGTLEKIRELVQNVE